MTQSLPLVPAPREAGPPRPALPPRELLDLFDVLEQDLRTRVCAHGYSATLRFLLARGLPVQPALAFLKAHGGHCDCTVLTRVERNWWRAPVARETA